MRLTMRDKRTITFYIFVYVFSESFFQISKSNQFFKLNHQNGVISSVGTIGSGGELKGPLHDEIFQIICNGPVWDQKPVNMSNV